MDHPDVDASWDYADPAGSEGRFRALLADGGGAADPGLRVELLSQLSRAVCLQRRYDEARAILDGAAPLLPEGGRPRVRWLLESGRLHHDTGRTGDALAAFEEAWRLAEAAGETALAADALHMAAFASRGEESVRRHRVALEYCARHDDGRLRRWRLPLLLNLGDALERLGRYAEAGESVEAAAALAEDLGLPARAVGARVFLARLHRLGGDPGRAWSILEGVFDPATADGWAFEERAECLHALGRFDEARPAFREAHARHAADPWFPPQEAARLERLRRLAEGGPEGG